MSFAIINIDTTCPPYDGLSSMSSLFEMAESSGISGLAIIGHGFLYRVPDFMKAAEKHLSVKPVIGCEICLSEHKESSHLTLLAKNLTGYRNLLKICSEAAVSGQYRSEPKVSREFLEQHHEGLIALQTTGSPGDMEVLEKIERFSIWSKPQLPEYPIPAQFKDADDALRGKVCWHLEDLGLKGNDVYEARVEKELSMIRERHCADYFLIVSDLCEKIWERGGIVGPGRGMSASLLVNYLIGITEINPLEFGLIPERFFSYNIEILPDIDIDTDEKGRKIALEYLAEKYGSDRVAGISDWKGPRKDWYDAAAGNERATYEADRLENGICPQGVHPSGLLLGRNSLDEYIPLTLHFDSETGESRVVSQYDAHYVEDCGPVKLDLVVLNTLGCSVLAAPESLDDKETMELFARGDTTGVFQFESEGMKQELQNVKPEKFEHLVAQNAMYRPGAKARIPMYVALKNGTFNGCKSMKPDNPFPELHYITDETFGMIIYQEQLMSIVSSVASFSLKEQKKLRKFAGPFHISQMVDGVWVDVLDSLGKRFVEGGIANGYDRKELKRFWKGFVRTDRAAYLFNKSHCVCYTLIGYQCAYLKVHSPAVFYNSLYPSLKCVEERKALLEDALKHGIVFMEECGLFSESLDN